MKVAIMFTCLVITGPNENAIHNTFRYFHYFPSEKMDKIQIDVQIARVLYAYDDESRLKHSWWTQISRHDASFDLSIWPHHTHHFNMKCKRIYDMQFKRWIQGWFRWSYIKKKMPFEMSNASKRSRKKKLHFFYSPNYKRSTSLLFFYYCRHASLLFPIFYLHPLKTVEKWCTEAMARKEINQMSVCNALNTHKKWFC